MHFLNHSEMTVLMNLKVSILTVGNAISDLEDNPEEANKIERTRGRTLKGTLNESIDGSIDGTLEGTKESILD